MHMREWIALFFCLGFFILMIVTAKGSQIKDIGVIGVPQKEKIRITIMDKETEIGSYECQPGVSLAALLKNIPIEAPKGKKEGQRKKILYAPQIVEVSGKTPFAGNR